ncbi:hypothetical protein VTL71DRAFT_9578 [Oculimacula yallundae]|uniref:Uncharacterized protein n=1 Tax=Oculimacula yallundae TaxID=86028 RepID=A0ABR4BRB5_9HELO
MRVNPARSTLYIKLFETQRISGWNIIIRKEQCVKVIQFLHFVQLRLSFLQQHLSLHVYVFFLGLPPRIVLHP